MKEQVESMEGVLFLFWMDLVAVSLGEGDSKDV